MGKKRRRVRHPLIGTPYDKNAFWYRTYLDETNWAPSYDVTTRLIQQMDLGLGVELGTGYGWHAEQILLRCPTASVITVDAYDLAVDDMIQKWNKGRYEQIYQETLQRLKPFGDRATQLRMTTMDAIEHAPASFEWIYVDASHDYESCLADLETWAPRATRLLMGHDYGQPDHPGVKQAVDEYLAAAGLKLAGVTDYVWWAPIHG